MSIYVCSHCGNYVDSDFDLPAEDCGEEVCPNCAETYFDEDGNLIEEQAEMEKDPAFDAFVVQRQRSSLNAMIEDYK